MQGSLLTIHARRLAWLTWQSTEQQHSSGPRSSPYLPLVVRAWWAQVGWALPPSTLLLLLSSQVCEPLLNPALPNPRRRRPRFIMELQDVSKDTEWRIFLQNGRPVKEQVPHTSGVARLSTGVDINYTLFRMSFGTSTVPQPQPSAPSMQLPAANGVGSLNSLYQASMFTARSNFSTPAPYSPPSVNAPAPPTHSPPSAYNPTPPHPTHEEAPCERILMIMGFAAPADAWLPTLHQMLRISHREVPPVPCTIEVCIFDNRGIGKSSVPLAKREYTTSVMAADAIGLMTHLKWSSAHIVGFSMGGMIATKLAAANPHCVRSLTLICVTGGNWQVLPATRSAMKVAIRGLTDKSNAGRAWMDVKFHFSRATRRARFGTQTVGQLLIQEYVRESEVSGRQHPAGQDGHLNAVWEHEVTKQDVKQIVSAGFPVKVIHGVHDLMAQPKYGRRMAVKLGAHLVLVDGGHLTPRENAIEIAHELLATVFRRAGLSWQLQHCDHRRPLFSGDAHSHGGDPLLGAKKGRSLAACLCCQPKIDDA